MLMVACVYVATTISAAATGKSKAASVSKPDMVKAAIDRDVAWGKFVKKFHKNFKGDSQVKTRYCVALLISLYLNANAFESVVKLSAE